MVLFVAHQVAIVYMVLDKLSKVPVNKVARSSGNDRIHGSSKAALDSIAAGKWTDAELGY